MGKHYLVTGGAGFIGSHLVDRLLHEGHRVTTIDSFSDYYDPALKRRNLQEAEKSSNFTLFEGDICDRNLVDSAMTLGPVDTVIHLAARAGVRPSILDPQAYYRVNCLGTSNLLESCVKHGIRHFIFASSSSVYGENAHVPFHEEMRVDRPVSPYAATKQAGEGLVYSFHENHDLHATCLRFFTVYGPRQRPEMAIHKFLTAVLTGAPVTLFGDGSTSRDYTYVLDAVEGIIQAVQHAADFRIFNIGSGRPIQLRDLVTTIGQVTGKQPLLQFESMQMGDVTHTFADIRRAREELGYRPDTDLETGLCRMLDWLAASEP